MRSENPGLAAVTVCVQYVVSDCLAWSRNEEELESRNP